MRAADHGRVVGGDHRVALTVHQDPQAPQVGVVDRGLVLVGNRCGFLVRALAQPDSRSGRRRGPGSPPRCASGRPAARCRARGSPARSSRTIDSVESVVVWSSASTVTHDAGLFGRGADLVRVLERDLVSVPRQELSERGKLQRHLDVARRPRRRSPGHACASAASSVEVVRRRCLLACVEIGGVLTEVVDGDVAAGVEDRLGGRGDRLGARCRRRRTGRRRVAVSRNL